MSNMWNRYSVLMRSRARAVGIDKRQNGSQNFIHEPALKQTLLDNLRSAFVIVGMRSHSSHINFW